jgi:hypothetical protein
MIVFGGFNGGQLGVPGRRLLTSIEVPGRARVALRTITPTAKLDTSFHQVSKDVDKLRTMLSNGDENQKILADLEANVQYIQDTTRAGMVELVYSKDQAVAEASEATAKLNFVSGVVYIGCGLMIMVLGVVVLRRLHARMSTSDPMHRTEEEEADIEIQGELSGPAPAMSTSIAPLVETLCAPKLAAIEQPQDSANAVQCLGDNLMNSDFQELGPHPPLPLANVGGSKDSTTFAETKVRLKTLASRFVPTRSRAPVMAAGTDNNGESLSAESRASMTFSRRSLFSNFAAATVAGHISPAKAFKSKPKLGVVLLDAPRQVENAVSAEVICDNGVCANVEFVSKMKLAKGMNYDLEVNSPEKDQSVFLQVAALPEGFSFDTVPLDVIKEIVFDAEGRFSAYGTPTTTDFVDHGVEGSVRMIEGSFSILTPGGAGVPKRVVISVAQPEGSPNVMMLVGSASERCWDDKKDAICDAVRSFRVANTRSSKLTRTLNSDYRYSGGIEDVASQQDFADEVDFL